MIRELWRNLWPPLVFALVAAACLWTTFLRADPVLLEVTHYLGSYVIDGPGVQYKGTLTVTVTREKEKDRYSAAVVGTYLGRSYFLPVSFHGLPDNLKGSQVVIGTQVFKWQGEIAEGVFKGMLMSKDYTGSFKLKEKTQ